MNWYSGRRSVYEWRWIDSLPNAVGHPFKRALGKEDINFRRCTASGVAAQDAGFDNIVYATHTYLLSNFLNPKTNTRHDEYGGSLENRVRLVRELIEETKEAVGEHCAVAVRFAADEEIGEDGIPIHGERRDMIGLLANLPDLWDINIANYSVEMGVYVSLKKRFLNPLWIL